MTASPVLRMTRPSVHVPLPRQTTLDERGAALFELENNVIHESTGASLHTADMSLELIRSVSNYLRTFTHPFDHKLFIVLSNETRLRDTGYCKVRNLMNLTPSGADEAGGIPTVLKVMNGLNLWGFHVDDLMDDELVVQAKALMHVTMRLILLEDAEEFIDSYYSGLRRATFITDPELVDLVKQYPEHHERIADAVTARQSVDVGLLREMIETGSLAVNEGQL